MDILDIAHNLASSVEDHACHIGFENCLTSSQLPRTQMKGGPSPSSLGLLSSKTHLISSLHRQYTSISAACVSGGHTGMDKDSLRELEHKLEILGRHNLLYTLLPVSPNLSCSHYRPQ